MEVDIISVPEIDESILVKGWCKIERAEKRFRLSEPTSPKLQDLSIMLCFISACKITLFN